MPHKTLVTRMKESRARKEAMKPKQATSKAAQQAVASKHFSRPTARGKRILKKREDDLKAARTCMVMRGNKSSELVLGILDFSTRVRGVNAMFYKRKHPELTDLFGDEAAVAYLEKSCVKFGHSLFEVGSSNKKRPCRVAYGRLYDKTLLDMQEFCVSNYRAASFPPGVAPYAPGSKPLLVFRGDAFEHDERSRRVRNLLQDMHGGPTTQGVLIQGIDRAVVVEALEQRTDGVVTHVYTVRNYRVELKAQKENATQPRVELRDCGPSYVLTPDREIVAERGRWKAAMQAPKLVKKVKNVKTNVLGQAKARLFLDKQDLDRVYTPHYLGRTSASKKVESGGALPAASHDEHAS